MYLNFSGSKTDAKTWFIDLDGVLAMHNQYKSGNDELIEGSREALSKISKRYCNNHNRETIQVQERYYCYPQKK